MKVVYIIFNHDEYGPVFAFACLRKESIKDEFLAQSTAFCNLNDLDAAVKELDRLLEMDDDMLLEMGNMPLLKGWGGPNLRLVPLE